MVLSHIVDSSSNTLHHFLAIEDRSSFLQRAAPGLNDEEPAEHGFNCDPAAVNDLVC